MKISAVIVTRGDVDLTKPLKPLLDSDVLLDLIVWDNAAGVVHRYAKKNDPFKGVVGHTFGDRGAFGRYAAIEYAWGDVIYFQDDDCVVQSSDLDRLVEAYEPGVLTALMPPSRTDYTDTVLIGWGSIFDRDLPEKAFYRWRENDGDVSSEDFLIVGCDFIFPMLTPWKRLDAEHTDLPWAFNNTRTWQRRGYTETKARYLHQLRKIRDAS